MGTNNKHSPSSERTFANGSPSNKKSSSGSQRPSPSKSINIRTPSKNQASSAGGPNVKGKHLSGSSSPPNFSFFAGSKCFESPSPQSLPKPPMSWFDERGNKNEDLKAAGRTQRVRKSLILSTETCAQQQNSFASINSNDHYTQNLKLLLNVTA